MEAVLKPWCDSILTDKLNMSIFMSILDQQNKCLTGSLLSATITPQ